MLTKLKNFFKKPVSEVVKPIAVVVPTEKKPRKPRKPKEVASTTKTEKEILTLIEFPSDIMQKSPSISLLKGFT